MNNLESYPDSPEIKDPLFLEPSIEYENQVVAVAKSISTFIGTYIGMLVVTAGLSTACITFGIFLLKSFGIFTAFLGAGAIGIGGMLLAFFAKSLFGKRYTLHKGKVEITASNEPELYEFIHMVCAEVGTDVPNKIYLSPDINASVTYESTFWSMFKPVKKDLTIGLGLMNSLNMSEFKGVLAHEFGHFSQKSMKMGSYVYTMNRIIHDLVFTYDNWDQTINKWASSGGLWGLFGKIPKAFANGARFILEKMYNPINLKNLELSRQMEFHADKHAIFAAGTQASISAIRRSHFALRCYDFVTTKLDQALGLGLKTDNIYQVQRWAMKHFAKELNMNVEYGLPVITNDDVTKLNKSRIKYTDQWASHPNLEDREANMKAPIVHAEISKANPLNLLQDAEKWEKHFTTDLYKDIRSEEKMAITPIEEILDRIEKETVRYTIPEVFNGYYNGRALEEFNLEKVVKKYKKGNLELKTFEDIFAPEHQGRIDRYHYDLEDMKTLELIKEGYISTKYFEFDGMRYPVSEAAAGIRKLEKDSNRTERWLKENDKQAFLFFYKMSESLGKSDEYLNVYREQFAFRGNKVMCEEWLSAIRLKYLIIQLQEDISAHSVRVFVEEIAGIEDVFKKALQMAQKEGELKGMNKPLKKLIKDYLSDSNNYFIGSHYHPEQFRDFVNLVADVGNHFANRYLDRLIEIFKYQEFLLGKSLAEENSNKEEEGQAEAN